MSQDSSLWDNEEEDFDENDFDFDELIPEIKSFVYEWMRENSKQIIERYIKEKEKELLGSQSVKPKMKREGAYLDLTQSDICATKKEKWLGRSTPPKTESTHDMLYTAPKKKRE